MKEKFAGYYQIPKEQIAEIWQSAVFIFDANVLLGLYRYPKETSDDLLGILETISQRVWLPHQAALEYQENRLQEISNQVSTFHKVKSVLGKIEESLFQEINALQLRKRHSTIDPRKFMDDVSELFRQFSQQLDEIKKEQPNIKDEDKLRIEIDDIFSGRVGHSFESQEVLDSIYKEGEYRYAHKIPPGYMDTGKEEELSRKGLSPSYLSDGMVIERKFGDLLLWKQLLKEARDNPQFKKIIFVTDDNKEDWWLKVKRSGFRELEIVGARPELVSEIYTEADVDSFIMYQTDTFMEDAKKYLGIDIRPESVNQVRDVRTIQLDNIRQTKEIYKQFELAEIAFKNWLHKQYPDDEIEQQRYSFPDLIRTNANNSKIGYEIKLVRHIQSVRRFYDLAYRGYYEVNEGDLDQLNLVIVIDENIESDGERIQRELLRLKSRIPKGISIISGELLSEDSDGKEVLVFAEMPSQLSLEM